MGANVSELVILFTRQFSKLVIIAFIISTPVAYYTVQSWLSGFAYQTPIVAWVFILGGVITLGIAWLTTGFQSLKAAHINPVETLRDE